MNINSSTIKPKLLNYFTAAIIAIISSLVFIIIFAIAIKWFSPSDAIILPINMVIKVVSLLLGLIYLLQDKTKGLKKGLILGSIYWLISFVLFSVLLGSFNFGLGSLFDLLFVLAAAGIIGIVLVNIKR